ncbi:sperm microtubule associated protein 2-like [Engraulis encrasicolus]|uniref:sperm microtubule associated protein 2-like n=1 Tax=Engraulis encrasicolus TaxID=184585 RepID=UPI002FD567E4
MGWKMEPHSRVIELAQPKDPKTIWLTTHWYVRWGNQEPIVPVSLAALKAVPTTRVRTLAQPKKDFKLLQTREEEKLLHSRRSSSAHKASQYEHIIRLSTPKRRSISSQENRTPHTPWCEHNCPIWHVYPKAQSTYLSPRLRQLASPKLNHPDFRSNRETVEGYISLPARSGQATPRLDMLAMPKRQESGMFYDRGRPEKPIWAVSKAAMQARASPRVDELSQPKPLNKDYLPPKELF